jgi:gamma-aminobutyric acid receptor subunit beta
MLSPVSVKRFVLSSLLPMLLLLALATPAQAAGEESNYEGPVYVSVVILDVDSISSANQSFTINYYAQFRWTDPELAHPGPGLIRRDLSEIPAPRFILLNQQKTWSSLINVVDISPEGEAIYRQRLWGDFSQPLHLQDFPFDQHTFELPIIGVGDIGEDVVLLPDPVRPSFIAENLSVADWRIIESAAQSREIELMDEALVQGFVFSFRAERLFNHYVIKFIIPLILIVAMSWVVFWIDPTEAGSQLSVAVTAALTLIAYHIALAGKLPDIPYLTRMDLFLFCSTLLVFSALLEVVLTSRLARDGRLVLARRFDQVCRLLFPAAYVAIAAWALGSPTA